MKFPPFILISGIVIFAACSSPKPVAVAEKVVTADTTDIKPDPNDPLANDINTFFKRFEAATLSHNSQRIMQFIDKDYREIQHDQYMKKNTAVFLNLFYSGNTTNNTGVTENIRPDFTHIVSMKQLETGRVNGIYRVKYDLTLKSGVVIKADWTLVIKLNGTGISYGLMGPVASE